MALDKQTITLPLFLGRDGGSDKKVVRESLLEAKNVIHDTDGALSKRPPLERTYTTDAGSILVAADSETCVLSDRTVEYDGPDTSGFRLKPNTVQPQLRVRAQRMSAVAGAGGTGIPFVSWMRGVDSTTEGRQVPTLQAHVTYSVNDAGNLRGERHLLRAETSKHLKKEPEDAVKVFTRTGCYQFSDTVAIGNAFGGLTTPPFGVEAFDVFEADGTFDIGLVIGTNNGIKVLQVYVVNNNSGSQSEVLVSLPSNVLVSRVAGYWDGATSELCVVMYANFDSPRPTLLVYRFSLSPLAYVSNEYIIPTEDYDSVDMLSFAGVSSDSGADASGKGFWAILEGTSSQSYDHLVCTIPSSPVWAHVPKGSRLHCRSIYDSEGDKHYTVLQIGQASSLTIAAGGGITENASPTAISTYVILDESLNVSAQLLPREAFPIDISARGPYPHYLSSSDPYRYDNTEGQEERLIVVLAGSTVPTVTLLSIGVGSQKPHHIPRVSYDSDTLVASPHLWRAPSGSALYKHYPPTVDLEEQFPGSLELLGEYSYRVLPLISDSSGKVIYGRPTEPLLITLTGANRGVKLRLRDVLTNDASVIAYEVYRTANNGSTYGFVGTIYDTVDGSFSDAVADADRSSVLYTDLVGDGLSHNSPPGATDMWVHDGRLWLIPVDDSNVLWYSRKRPDESRQLITPAGEGLSFSVVNSLQLNTPGRLQRGTSFGGACIIFSTRGVYIIGGAGPDATGLSGRFSEPQQLAAPTLTDPLSLVNTGQYLFYKSDDTFILMDRGFNVRDVGRPMRDRKDYPVTAAIARSEAKIQLISSTQPTADPTESSRSYVYDIDTDQWFYWRYGDPMSQMVRRDGYDRVVAHGGGYLYEEPIDISQYRDHDGTAFSDYLMVIETRWFNLNEFAGFQRLYELAMLGEYKSPHTLKVSIYYDYNDTAAEYITKAVSSVQTPYLFKWQPKKQVNRAFKIRIEETAPSGGTYESFTLTGFQATIGVKPRTHYSATESL